MDTFPQSNKLIPYIKEGDRGKIYLMNFARAPKED